MNKNIVVLTTLFVFVFFLSCKLQKKTSKIDEINTYRNYLGDKNLYIVDTIYIIDPVRITTTTGHCFIISKNQLESYNGKEGFFFNNNEIFLFEDNLPMSLPSEIFKKYATGTACYEYSKLIDYKIKGIESIYEYTSPPDFFLLILINGEYYNNVYTGIDDPKKIILSNNKFSYYPLVIPFCKYQESIF